MIKKLIIRNYKSIKQLDIDCKKINVFIGEPNTGKSNIVEALNFFSPHGADWTDMKEVLRIKTFTDLFFDFNYSKPIIIETEGIRFKLYFVVDKNGIATNEFQGEFFNLSKEEPNPSIPFSSFTRTYEGQRSSSQSRPGPNANIRNYYYKRQMEFLPAIVNYLSTPFGANMPGLLISNPELRKMVSDIFKEKGFRLQLKPVENDISISKEVNDELYSYPYYAISETLQRIVFLMLAIESNKNCTLCFDEPESNTFPFYTKYIAERIALDETNQFFLTTHNPYLLMSIIEKAKLPDLNVFITRMENYETKVYPLNKKQLEMAFEYDADVFFNLDRIIEE